MSISIFNSEEAMQTWLSKELKKNDCFSDLLINLADFEQYTPTGVTERKVFESFKYCLESFNIVTVVSENEDISFKPSDSLKPDFLLYAPETESMIIIELKNIVTPSRQVGTELSAYSSEIKSHIPFIFDGDIVNVIISSVWPTLLKHYAFHEIFWQQRNIICLKPVKRGKNIKLKIIDVRSIAEDAISLKLGNEHLGGYQICLYDDDLYTSPANRERLDAYLMQMSTAMNAMASKGNSQKNHGFAFLWKDKLNATLAPYNITVLNFSPFQSFERHFHAEDFEPNEIAKRFITIIKEHDPMGHGNSLQAITAQGDLFLKSFCTPRCEGFFNWDILKEGMLRKGKLISFRSWGVFEEIYSDKLLQYYQAGRQDLEFDNPAVGLEILDELIDPDYEFYHLSSFEESEEEVDEDTDEDLLF